MARLTTRRTVLAKATEVLDTREAAKEWLRTPGMALNCQRPSELPSTPADVESVERLLGQMEHCIYV
jgi:putative toxin-antitoxin system antitoxin component (TIGR02293 family)